eukprot:5201859-Prorocentrum_lima.AAC.1
MSALYEHGKKGESSPQASIGAGWLQPQRQGGQHPKQPNISSCQVRRQRPAASAEWRGRCRVI